MGPDAVNVPLSATSVPLSCRKTRGWGQVCQHGRAVWHCPSHRSLHFERRDTNEPRSSSAWKKMQVYPGTGGPLLDLGTLTSLTSVTPFLQALQTAVPRTPLGRSTPGTAAVQLGKLAQPCSPRGPRPRVSPKTGAACDLITLFSRASGARDRGGQGGGRSALPLPVFSSFYFPGFANSAPEPVPTLGSQEKRTVFPQTPLRLKTKVRQTTSTTTNKQKEPFGGKPTGINAKMAAK